MSDRVSLGMSALTYALQLKNGELDAMTLADLHARAERFAPTDPLFVAITEAVVQVEVAHTPDALRLIGARLHERLSALFIPDVPGQDRVDIYG